MAIVSRKSLIVYIKNSKEFTPFLELSMIWIISFIPQENMPYGILFMIVIFTCGILIQRLILVQILHPFMQEVVNCQTNESVENR